MSKDSVSRVTFGSSNTHRLSAYWACRHGAITRCASLRCRSAKFHEVLGDSDRLACMRMFCFFHFLIHVPKLPGAAYS